MHNGKIGVGIIGVQPGRSFAAMAHIPALKALPQFEIAALSTTKRASAQAAAKEYGVPRAYDDHQALVADPSVDLVIVAVKVPHHFELVSAALNAGKAVFCEWPLGNGLAEAEKMAALAKQKGLYNAVGLQARAAPAVSYVRDLVQAGQLGEIQSTTLIGTGMNWGAMVETPNVYTADKKNGATLLTIPFGHTVDALCHALGELREVVATISNRRTSTKVVETGATIPLTSEDQIAVSGKLVSGAVLCAHYRGGMPRGTGLLWEINGTEGDLQLTSIGGHAQIFELTLRGALGAEQSLQPMTIPDRYRWGPAISPWAYNVGQAFVRLAADMRDGTHQVPTFEDAAKRHRMLAAIEQSAAAGQRVAIAP